MPKTSKAHAMFFFLRAGEFFSAAEKLFASEKQSNSSTQMGISDLFLLLTRGGAGFEGVLAVAQA